VAKDSLIKSLKDLKGKKIAATKGTDPSCSCCAACTRKVCRSPTSRFSRSSMPTAAPRSNKAGGRLGGLDPLMAGSEIQAGSRILHRNVAFNTYGFLNTTEPSPNAPEQTRRVIAAYEKARKWIIANPARRQAGVRRGEAAAEVARLQLKRNDFSNPVPGAEHVTRSRPRRPSWSRRISSGRAPT
jgi:sulfonate transport system substrate-binding protein